MLSENYCTAVVASVKKVLHQKGLQLPSKYTTPIGSVYRLEMDAITEFKAIDIIWYQDLTGKVR